MESSRPKLHLGCGMTTPRGWINLDGSWNAWFAKHPTLRSILGAAKLAPRGKLEAQWSKDILVHDVRKRLPFDDQSLSIIYTSHLLEHLYVTEADKVLAECYRVLEPGGVLRVVVPDLASIVERYVKSVSANGSSASEEMTPADRMNVQLLLRFQTPPSGGMFFRMYSALKDFHSHKWMYDAQSLICRLEKAGFTELARREYLQSRIQDVDAVEKAPRVLDGAGVCVEGIKPTPPAGEVA